MSWKIEDLGLRVGQKLRYVGESKYRYEGWKPAVWFEKGSMGTIIRLNKGSPKFDGLTETEAWASVALDSDENAIIAITKKSKTEWKSVEEADEMESEVIKHEKMSVKR